MIHGVWTCYSKTMADEPDAPREGAGSAGRTSTEVPPTERD